MRRKTAAFALASAAILTAGSALAQTPAVEDIFKAWDKNADGVVDKAEWVAAGRPEARFARVDTDSDGKITLDELKAAMARMQARRQQQGGAAQTPPADH